MTFKNLSIFLSTVFLVAACSQEEEQEAQDTAQNMPMPETTLLDVAIEGIGGADLLQNMNSFAVSGSGNRYELDESPIPGGVDPRPEGFEWTVNAQNIGGNDVLVRIDISRDRAAGNHASTQIINGTQGMITGLDSQFNPNPAPMTSDRRAAILKELYLLQPQAVLAIAQENPDQVEISEDIVNGMNYGVLAVSTDVGTISLYVDEARGLIDRATTMELDYLRGDILLEASFDDWRVGGSDMLYPGSVTLTSDDVVLHEERRRSISLNVPMQAEDFDIPTELLTGFDQELHDFGANSSEVYMNMASAGFPRSGFSTDVLSEEIAPGVFYITGSSHHSLVVEQENGLVVIEAPLHYLRSQVVINWIEENIPDKAVSHVIATHHHTDHSAGMRTYIDAGATVVAHEAAVDFYNEVLPNPHTLGHGAGALTSLTIESMPADGSYTIEDASNPVTVYPLDSGGHANDMLMAYVEEPGILFTSDTFSPNPNMTEANDGARMVRESIEAAGIEPSIFVGGHGAAMSGDAFQALFD
tara:strand:+ start:196534 stop:198120 length:1587 start_codon:yes stop_codon:yes gene_type:complete